MLESGDIRKTALTAIASSCRPVVVPCELPGLPVEVAADDGARVGLETALAKAPHLDAALFLASDQTWVTASSIRALLNAFQRTHLPIAAVREDRGFGLPALFSRTLFSEILAGKRLEEIIGEHRRQVAGVSEKEKAHSPSIEQRVGS